jgi:catechol 2,3-dioxygenase-like lactoylglutathione lyase family enzyme
MQINELHLLTADLAGTEQFYGGKLQLPVLQRTPEALAFQIGHSVLWFRAAPAGSRPFYHVAFAVPLGSVDAALAWVGQNVGTLPFTDGLPIAEFQNWGARAFYFHDNNGSILECIGRAAQNAPALSEFRPATGFLSINEVGLVVPHVPAACAQLTAAYGVTPFFRGPSLPDFAAMGDDDGLFIVSADARGWLPTLRPAESHWLRVQFEQSRQLHQLELG